MSLAVAPHRMYALREYDARLAKEGKMNTSPNRFQRFIRSVANQIEELDVPAALDSMAIDAENIRLPKIQISAENREKLNAAGSQIKSSLTNAAGNVRKLWVTLQQQQEERRKEEGMRVYHRLLHIIIIPPQLSPLMEEVIVVIMEVITILNIINIIKVGMVCMYVCMYGMYGR